MKAIVLMFDSLNRKYLSAYGNDWTRAPNFLRLAERCLSFDTSYVCSTPCMPAHMWNAFSPAELQEHELVPSFSFMQGIRPLQIPCNKDGAPGHPEKNKTLYFDLTSDPLQQKPLRPVPREEELCALLHRHLVENDAPVEQWQRLGLSPRWNKPA